MFVKSIDTLPAFALRDVVSYFSSPEEAASSFTVSAAPLVASELPDALVSVAVDVVAGVLAAGVELSAEELVLEELPQPAITTSPTNSASAAGAERTPDRPALCNLTVDPPLFGAIRQQDASSRGSFPS
jgi:hypothetical protein